ncbi:MAG: hypothetical protein IMX00_06475 [Limnochordales bacterium]|nr:hypothetical protein [Limnochordales bacterium]
MASSTSSGTSRTPPAPATGGGASEVLRLPSHSYANRQLFRQEPHIAWTAADGDGSHYLALLNTGATSSQVSIRLSELGISGPHRLRDLWLHKDLGVAVDTIFVPVAPMGQGFCDWQER